MLEKVRCFREEQALDIRPLTFLIGENSTGKSTALGCIHALIGGRRSFRDGLDFNSEPHRMGAFSDIVRRGSQSLRLGFQVALSHSETMDIHYTLAGRERGSEPVVQEIRCTYKDGDVVFVLQDQPAERKKSMDLVSTLRITHKSKRPTFTFEADARQMDELTWGGLRYLDYELSLMMPKVFPKKPKAKLAKYVNFIEEIRSRTGSSRARLFHLGRAAYSFAPIRSRPERTYNPVKEVEDPEGSDMPVFLANISIESGDHWTRMKEQLIQFGRASGLFTDLHVRRHGKSISDPFQLQVKVRGPKANMLDTGYGVSQILPVLVSLFRAPRNTLFLMQQPEVHLHPKGQAELTSLLVGLTKRGDVAGHHFVVETHSDYMIRRARIEIMQGNIAPENVSLVYMEPVQNRVVVHNIGFDKEGNMLNVPKGYGKFFLAESDHLLGFKG